MTNAELAVLGLIAERPRHGYEIEGVIQERGMREWTEVGFSSIYYLLKKLEREGLIRGRAGRKTGRGPARKVYEMTAEGREAWRGAAQKALSRPKPWRTPLYAGPIPRPKADAPSFMARSFSSLSPRFAMASKVSESR